MAEGRHGGIEVLPVDAEQALVLEVSGTLDAATAETARGKLLDATVTLPPPRLVLLDLRDVDVISAAGVRALGEFAVTRARTGVRSAVLLEPHTLNAKFLRGGHLPVHGSATEAIRTEAPGGADEDRLGEQLAALTRVLLDAPSVTRALEQVVAATTVVVPHARLVSITLRDPGGRFFTPVEIPDIAADLDDVQYRTGAGPCLDAATPDGPAYALDQDLARPSAWPQFAAVATAHGLGAVLSTALLPASRPGGLTGALNIYAHRGGITPTDRHRSLLLATHASLALEHARGAEVAELERTHLKEAIGSRDVIGQAKGILMARQGLDAEAAFALLRRTSQDLNVKLAEIAEALVQNHAKLAPVEDA
ncbi:hypothetical protein GCM10027258_41920 [Amycolatopsis stemonae]